MVKSLKGKFKRKITILIAVVLIASMICSETAFAFLTDVDYPVMKKSFSSTANFDKEKLTASVTSDGLLKIVFNTQQLSCKFRLSLYKVGANKGDINLNIILDPETSYSGDGTLLYGFRYYLDPDEYDIKDGYYNVYIKRCDSIAEISELNEAVVEENPEINFGPEGLVYKNLEVRVKKGKFSIPKYNDVIAYNKSVRDFGENFKPDMYLDNSLDDIKFVLRNPSTNVYDTIDYYKQSFFKHVSDRICLGASSDYDKLLKIYEFVQNNFYYDTVAFTTHSLQYANPYDNLYHFENGMTSVNSQSGKVYTTCQGFSAIFLALARQQNIPTRFIYGHRLAIPSNDWRTEDNIDVTDHWWVESYVNGRWIFIDPTIGNSNKYNKTTGKWNYTGLTNYTYFDPSDDQIATSHVYKNVYPDFRYGKYMTDTNEINTVKSFLNQNADGTSSNPYGYYSYSYVKKNGQLINSEYDQNDITTWGDGKRTTFMLNYSKRLKQIKWKEYGLGGTLNLSGLKKLSYIDFSGNNLSSADLHNDTALKTAYLYSNKMDKIDLSGCTSLSLVRAQYNPLKSLIMNCNGQDRTWTCGDHGYFYFSYNKSLKKPLTIVAKPDVGYKLEGMYSTVTGNLINTKASYQFLPKASGYSIQFCLDPESYKYFLSSTSNMTSSRIKYLQAAVIRLNELGYYKPYYGLGTEESYTMQIQDAVTKFQVMNNINNTGNIGSQTWAALFSEDAAQMVDSYSYSIILRAYEEEKAAKAQAELEAKLLAEAEAAKAAAEAEAAILEDNENTENAEETSEQN